MNAGLRRWEQAGAGAFILSQPPCSDLTSLLTAVCRLAKARETPQRSSDPLPFVSSSDTTVMYSPHEIHTSGMFEDVRQLCCCGNWERTCSIVDAHQESSTSHLNVAANNCSLHTDAGTCAQRWTMNGRSFFLYRDWKQNPKNPNPPTSSTAFQVSALFNQAWKLVIEPVTFWSEMTTISKQSISF